MTEMTKMTKVVRVEEKEKETNVLPTNSDMSTRHMDLVFRALNGHNGNCDINVIEKMVNLQVEFDKREARKEYILAMSMLQSKLTSLKPTGVVDFHNKDRTIHTYYKHLTMRDITDVINPLLSESGLSYRFKTTYSTKTLEIEVSCVVSHSSGHCEESEMRGFPDDSGKKNKLQQLASTKTYLKRYTLCDMFGIAEGVDDDTQNQGDETQTSGNFCTDEYFQKNFNSWSGHITSGKKSSEQLIVFVENKGKKFTEEQKTTLRNVV